MTFPGRRRSFGHHSRQGQESLLLNPGPRSHNRNYDSGGSSIGASDSLRAKSVSRSERTTSMSPVDTRLAPPSRFLPQHFPRGTQPAEMELPAHEGVLQFVPAFDESQASWDAILNDGPTALPYQGTRSEIAAATASNRFRRKAQSVVGPHTTVMPRRQQDTESTFSASRTKGPRIARLASLFSSGSTKPTPVTTTTLKNKKYASHNTTDSTLPSSPSRSSSSGEYVGWPGTQDKKGHTVAFLPSYEESESAPSDPPARASPFGQDRYHHHEREKLEKEWMQSPAFQDISGIMADPDMSGMTLPEPPSPPGKKADDSLYYNKADQGFQDTGRAMHLNHTFPNQPGWDVDLHSSPSRSTFSKNSSAYFDNDVRPMAFPAFEGEKRRLAVAGVMRGASTTPQPPTEEALALNNSLSPPRRTFNAETARGYRGLIDKTHDVPNLMDALDSDSMGSSGRASSNVPSSTASGPPGVYNPSGRQSGHMPRVQEEEFKTGDSESDVFDEISKYSIGDSEPFEGISQSDSKQSILGMRDADPFDGIPQNIVEKSKASLHEIRSTTLSVEKRYQHNSKKTTKSKVKVVLLGGGLTAIQTTNSDFTNRISASDFDECLTNSDIDEFGNTRLPSFQEMVAAGRSPNDNASVVDISMSAEQSLTSKDSKTNISFPFLNAQGHKPNQQANSKVIGDTTVQRGADFGDEYHPKSQRSISTADHGYKDDESAFFSDFYSGDEMGSGGDLSEFYVQPSTVKRLVRQYRKMCRLTMSNCSNYDELDRAEDEKKVFALFEMRSRIMEKDIERGLERRGGTSVVDDLVTTPTNRRAMRIRDAVIVSKAWRDGATPIDVINTASLTQRDQRSYFIKRPYLAAPGRRGNLDKTMLRYRWEEVAWVDDTDFMLYRCPSLGARHLRGTEMFTIGDCQSILLKLTNEACMELRSELNYATARQIEAEEVMKEDGEYGEGMMTESEMAYLSAMEEVKTISKHLVVAEKAFALVRDRIRTLVAKYESLLVKIENEDLATSSVITSESSCYSDEYSSKGSTDYDEELAWYRRQQRAEVSAELAAREALLSKQSEARAMQEEKHREVRELQGRLAELQSEPSTSTLDRQRSVVLARAIAARQQSSKERVAQQNDNKNNQGIKVEGVKQRFRDRMAARLREKSNAAIQDRTDFAPVVAANQHPSTRYFMPEEPIPLVKSPSLVKRQKLIRLAGEEMFQYLDFYERSLKAVESSRVGAL